MLLGALPVLASPESIPVVFSRHMAVHFNKECNFSRA